MKSVLEEIGALAIHLRSLMDVQDRMLIQMVEHLLPLLVEQRKGKDSKVEERLNKLDELIKSDAWRTPNTEHDEQPKEKDVRRNYGKHRKEDEGESGARSDEESSEDGRGLFDVVV